MKVQSLKLVCFSPTGTTKSIILGIARGMHKGPVELIDITKAKVREKRLCLSEHDLLIVGVPVYIGRVPTLARDWLQTLEGCDTPVVCVVVYGNRAYEDALLELKDITQQRGCVPIGCGAYIGEHSFSQADAPIAVGRPDEDDIGHAEKFGWKLAEKLNSLRSVNDIGDITIPGNVPYRNAESSLPLDFIEVDDSCLRCGICAEACPVGAIDMENGTLLNREKCILCCACIKSCPQGARKMKPGAVKDIAIRLSALCAERKEPACFF